MTNEGEFYSCFFASFSLRIFHVEDIYFYDQKAVTVELNFFVGFLRRGHINELFFFARERTSRGTLQERHCENHILIVTFPNIQ